MKNIFKYLATAAMCISLTGLVGCEPEQVEPSNTPDPTVESALFAFQYDGQVMKAGDTIQYHPSMNQTAIDQASVDFFLINKTEEELSSVMKVELMAGATALNSLQICYADNCRVYTCPWTSDPITLVPGVNTDMKITIDYRPTDITTQSIYRVTIGKGTAMEEPQVMYLNMYAE